MTTATPSSSPRQFAVIGHPVSHSRSPAIHQHFGQLTGIALTYDRLPAPPDGFGPVVSDFFTRHPDGGLNVTLPFKEAAWEMAHNGLSERARRAGAVNTLWVSDGLLHGCNTDGVGLLDDLLRLGHAPEGRRILVLGAGGAARGLVGPLLAAGCAHLHVANRTAARAHALAAHFSDLPAIARLSVGALDDSATLSAGWDIVLNATASSLDAQAPALPAGTYRDGALAYDLVYADQPTPFMQQARTQGAADTADGLGMLVGQAAASFEIWHGVRPPVAPVMAALRPA